MTAENYLYLEYVCTNKRYTLQMYSF